MSVVTPAKTLFGRHFGGSPIQRLNFRECNSPDEHDGDESDSLIDTSASGSSGCDSILTNSDTKDDFMDTSIEGWDPSFGTPQHSPSRKSRRSLDQSPVSRLSSSPDSSPMLFKKENHAESRLTVRHDSNTNNSPSSSSTPPHKRLRNLRLFDTPHTPKSLIERSRPLTTTVTGSQRRTRGLGSRLFGNKHKNDLVLENRQTKSAPRLGATNNRKDAKLANVNPFTPSGLVLNASRKKRQRKEWVNTNDPGV